MAIIILSFFGIIYTYILQTNKQKIWKKWIRKRKGLRHVGCAVHALHGVKTRRIGANSTPIVSTHTTAPRVLQNTSGVAATTAPTRPRGGVEGVGVSCTPPISGGHMLSWGTSSPSLRSPWSWFSQYNITLLENDRIKVMWLIEKSSCALKLIVRVEKSMCTPFHRAGWDSLPSLAS